MITRPIWLFFHLSAASVDASTFKGDEWGRYEVVTIVRRHFVGRRLCVSPASPWVRIFGVKVGPDEVLSAVPNVSAPSSMFPPWTEERAALENFTNLGRRTAQPGESITVSFECRPVVFSGFLCAIFGEEML